MSQKIPETDYFSNAERDSLEEITALHRGAFCQSSFWCIYYYDSNKSTGKETGKTHLCSVQFLGWNFFWRFLQQDSSRSESFTLTFLP